MIRAYEMFFVDKDQSKNDLIQRNQRLFVSHAPMIYQETHCFEWPCLWKAPVQQNHRGQRCPADCLRGVYIAVHQPILKTYRGSLASQDPTESFFTLNIQSQPLAPKTIKHAWAWSDPVGPTASLQSIALLRLSIFDLWETRQQRNSGCFAWNFSCCCCCCCGGDGLAIC